jgi:hypothetical protein
MDKLRYVDRNENFSPRELTIYSYGTSSNGIWGRFQRLAAKVLHSIATTSPWNHSIITDQYKTTKIEKEIISNILSLQISDNLLSSCPTNYTVYVSSLQKLSKTSLRFSLFHDPLCLICRTAILSTKLKKKMQLKTRALGMKKNL